MPSYLHPGVYVEEIPSGSRPIEGVATSVAAFVGKANRGAIGEPVLIGSFSDYVAEFGDISDANDAMGLAVQAYYLNGGGSAFVCRLASGATSPSSVSLDAADASQTGIMTVTASSAGSWGDSLYVRTSNPTLLFDLEVGLNPGTFSVQERFYGLSLDGTRGDFVSTKVNGKSRLIRIDNVVESLTLANVAETDLTDEDSNAATPDTLTIQDSAPQTVMVVTDITTGATPVALRISNVTFVFDMEIGEQQASVFVALEKYVSVSMVSSRDDFVETVVNDQSALASVDVLTGATAAQYPLTGTGGAQLQGGLAANPTAPDYTGLYESTLRKYRDISIIVLPGESWAADGTGNSVISATLSHCDKMKNRVVIVDPPAGHELENANTVATMSLPTSTYSVLYYPWVAMANPLYHPDRAPDEDKTLLIPPSAIAAGMWAKIDGKRGVWKAPAGVEARLTGAAGLEFQVENLEQDQLNPLGINCIRNLPNYGSVFWGARTLSTNADPEWRYVPVRRTAIYIEESLYRGIQWAVFEPNDHPLWSSLRANIDSFMNGLFRAGAFQGSTAKEAYFVRCGLGDTMVQGDIDRGQVIVMVGFAPLKPAEFVIVRIQQKVGEER
ncbi:MAG: phage tail sheath subtilisin-like domain-containing protein [Gammaproteobacteria bacterium]|nr:phage tail sheath subtilisin-like domain-containing protein [Gammaproteobacteria bacterium]